MSTFAEIVSVKMTRLELYRILDASTIPNDTALNEVVSVARRNVDLPECESILGSIDEAFQESDEIYRDRQNEIGESL